MTKADEFLDEFFGSGPCDSCEYWPCKEDDPQKADYCPKRKDEYDDQRAGE